MHFPQSGGCQCGSVRYEITGPPTVVYACHCTECQKQSGSAFAMAAVIPQENFRITKGAPAMFFSCDQSVQKRWSAGSARIAVQGYTICRVPRLIPTATSSLERSTTRPGSGRRSISGRAARRNGSPSRRMRCAMKHNPKA